MKCENCGRGLVIQFATKIACQGCQVLTNLISIVTIRCDNCQHVSQVPVKSNKTFSVKKDSD